MKCVFSIMDNERGKKIYNEMMECWHDGSQFEFPGINMATSKAFKTIESMLKEPNSNRYFYEDMWLNTDIDVYGVLTNNINHYNVQEIGKYIKV